MKEVINAWISPAGESFPIKMMHHSDFVFQYIDDNDLHSVEISSDYYDINDFLHERGWFRIVQWWCHDEPIITPLNKRIPSVVKKAIVDIFLSAGKPNPSWLT